MNGPDPSRARPHIGTAREVLTAWFWRDMRDLWRDLRRMGSEERAALRAGVQAERERRRDG